MSVILWKILIVGIILAETMTVAFLGWRVLALMKRVKQVQEDRNAALKEWYKVQREKPILSELDKKMILNALKMPEYKGAIDEPTTHHYVRKAYRELKNKIKESMKDD